MSGISMTVNQNIKQSCCPGYLARPTKKRKKCSDNCSTLNSENNEFLFERKLKF